MVSNTNLFIPKVQNIKIKQKKVVATLTHIMMKMKITH